MKSKRKKILLNIALVLFLLFLVAVLVVLFAVGRDPDYFEDYAAEPTPEVIAASNACTEKILDLQLNYEMGRRIDITEREVNGYIRYGFESLAEYVPEEFASPQVRFRDGKIVLSARYVGSKVPFAPVLSVVAEPVNMEGGRIGCRVRTVNLGSLPVPAELAAEFVRRLESKTIDLKAMVNGVAGKAARELHLSDEQTSELGKLGELARKGEEKLLSKKDKLEDAESVNALSRKALRKINSATLKLKGGYSIEVGDGFISFIPPAKNLPARPKGLSR